MLEILKAHSHQVVLWVIFSVTYNLTFHQLALKYPGPIWGKASVLYQVYQQLTGRMPHTLQNLHQKYGPIVRVAPNELSFDKSSAWKEIYGTLTTATRRWFNGRLLIISQDSAHKVGIAHLRKIPRSMAPERQAPLRL